MCIRDSNNTASGSAKNKKARELGVPIIDENTIIEWLKNGIQDYGGK